MKGPLVQRFSKYLKCVWLPIDIIQIFNRLHEEEYLRSKESVPLDQ